MSLENEKDLKSTAQHFEVVPTLGDHRQPAENVAHIDSAVAAGVAASVEDYETLVAEAQAATLREQNMSIREAFRTYPKAVGWSLLLSTAIIMEGYDTALLNPFYAFPPFLEKFGQPDADGKLYISATWQNGLGNAAGVGGILGLQAAGIISERYGYRYTIMGSLIAMSGFIFIPFFSNSLGMLLAGEFLQGLSWGTFQTITTAYGAEVCPVAMRHVLTTYVNLCWVIGQLISAGVLRAMLSRTDEWGYRIPFALQWLWPPLIILGCIFAPESPWWLVRKGRHAQAERSLRRLAKKEGFTDDDLRRQMALMIHTNEMEKQVKVGTSYFDCFKGTELRRTEIVCLVWMIQTLCGSPLMGLSSYFYTQAGMATEKAFDFSIGQYALGACGTVGSWFLMTKVGRRPLYLYGACALFVLLIIIGGMGIPKTMSPGLSWTAGTMMLLFTGIYDLTIGPVCYCLCAEIPSTRLRAKSIVLARNAYNLVGIVANVITPRMLNQTAWNWGPKAGFFWAGSCALCILWIFFRLPEVKGRTYGELDILFENKIPARKFASTAVDQYGDVDKLKAEGYLGAPGAVH